MQQSKQVLEWQAEARKEGALKGRAEGKAQGKAEGKAEGRAEGKAEAKAEAVLRLLQRHTGRTIPLDLVNTIRNTKDSALLDHWIDVAADVTSLKEFHRQANL